MDPVLRIIPAPTLACIHTHACMHACFAPSTHANSQSRECTNACMRPPASPSSTEVPMSIDPLRLPGGALRMKEEEDEGTGGEEAGASRGAEGTLAANREEERGMYALASYRLWPTMQGLSTHTCERVCPAMVKWSIGRVTTPSFHLQRLYGWK